MPVLSTATARVGRAGAEVDQLAAEPLEGTGHGVALKVQTLSHSLASYWLSTSEVGRAVSTPVSPALKGLQGSLHWEGSLVAVSGLRRPLHTHR